MRTRVFCLVLWIVGLSTASLQAQENPSSTYPAGMSAFQWKLAQRALAKHDLPGVLEPEDARGKTIEEILVVTEDPLTPDDPWPDWGNLFHATSRDYVIQRELLFEEGDAFTPERALESARNLRGPLVLSVVLVLAVPGSSPDKVKVLVVTRDIWSLRTNTNFEFVGDTLNFFSLSLSENNILGLHKQGALTSLLQQDTLSLGEYYADPRVLGSRWSAYESFSLIFNRDTGEAEGYALGASLAHPLFSLRTPWAGGISLSSTRQIARIFEGSEVRTFDNNNTPEVVEELPYIYRYRTFSVSSSITRSFGTTLKQNVSLGHTFADQKFEFGENDAQKAAFSSNENDASFVRAFERNLLPRSERTSTLSLTYRIFTADDYLALRDFNSFALSEDFRFGPSLELGAGHAEPALGSDARFQRMNGSFLYRWLFGDRDRPSRHADILVISASYETRVQNGEFQDNQITANVQNFSPVLGGGRLVWRGVGVVRVNDLSNRQNGIGGNAGLRGFPSSAFLTTSYVRSNLEWRTLPIGFWNFQLGAVAFYDAAGVSAEEKFQDPSFYHSVGVGGRLLNPASNRIVMRFDWGFPLNGPYATLPGSLSFGFEQAF